MSSPNQKVPQCFSQVLFLTLLGENMNLILERRQAMGKRMMGRETARNRLGQGALRDLLGRPHSTATAFLMTFVSTTTRNTASLGLPEGLLCEEKDCFISGCHVPLPAGRAAQASIPVRGHLGRAEIQFLSLRKSSALPHCQESELW